MYMFGLKRIKPLAAARFAGLQFLRIGRHEAKPASSSIIYLRHASAMSAAIAKNLTAIMNQPGEILQETISKTDAEFIENHNHYSFVVVLVLMSLFMVLTISATGLMLAFCRKKNTVFIEPTKDELDSQFELDDIENTGLKTCRGKEGEFYIHLSDEYDEDDNEELKDGEKRDKEDPKRHEIHAQHRPTKPSNRVADRVANENGALNDLTPLIGPITCDRCRGRSIFDNNCSGIKFPPDQQCQGHVKGTANNRFSYGHTHLSHTHSRQTKFSISIQPHRVYFYRNQRPCYGLERLKRSHTIHAIPQSGSGSNPNSTEIKTYYDNQVINRTGNGSHPRQVVDPKHHNSYGIVKTWKKSKLNYPVDNKLWDRHAIPRATQGPQSSKMVYAKCCYIQATLQTEKGSISTLDARHHDTNTIPQTVKGPQQTSIDTIQYISNSPHPVKVPQPTSIYTKQYDIKKTPQTFKEPQQTLSLNTKQYEGSKTQHPVMGSQPKSLLHTKQDDINKTQQTIKGSKPKSLLHTKQDDINKTQQTIKGSHSSLTKNNIHPDPNRTPHTVKEAKTISAEAPKYRHPNAAPREGVGPNLKTTTHKRCNVKHIPSSGRVSPSPSSVDTNDTVVFKPHT